MIGFEAIRCWIMYTFLWYLLSAIAYISSPSWSSRAVAGEACSTRVSIQEVSRTRGMDVCRHLSSTWSHLLPVETNATQRRHAGAGVTSGDIRCQTRAVLPGTNAIKPDACAYAADCKERHCISTDVRLQHCKRINTQWMTYSSSWRLLRFVSSVISRPVR